jgi:hypothetical protein
MLSRRFVVSPREGHLQQVFHLFAYLKHHKRSKMVFDDTEPMFDETAFKVCKATRRSHTGVFVIRKDKTLWKHRLSVRSFV